MPPRLLLPLLLLLQAPAAAFAACGPLPPGTPAITPAPRDADRARRAAEATLAGLRGPPGRTLLVGDSILAGWRRAGAELGWPVANFAVSGDRTEHVLDRIDRADFPPGAFPRAVVLIGTNNLGRDGSCEVLGGIRAVVERLRARLPEAEILVLTLLPRGPRMATARATIEAVNQGLATGPGAAPGRGVAVLDAFTPFARACDGQEECPLLPDRLHPGPEGYAVLGRVLREALQAR